MLALVYTKCSGRAAYLAVLATLLLLMTGCQTADSSLDRVRSSGTLRVGLDPTYPPFEVADANGVTGLDVDLATELVAGLSDSAGAPVVPAFTYFGYDGLYDALLTDQVDVLISALVVSPERTRDFAYSRSYFDAGQVLVVPFHSPIAATDELTGQRVAVELGALGHVEATSLAQTLAGMEVRPYPGAEEALLAVVDGEADAAIVDSISGRLFLHNAPGPARSLTILPEPVSSELFAVVVRIENETLLEAIDAELLAMEDDGRLAEIIDRWLGSSRLDQ